MNNSNTKEVVSITESQVIPMKENLLPPRNTEYSPIEMTYLSYLITKNKYDEYQAMNALIARSALKYTLAFLYFLSLTIVRRIEKENKQDSPPNANYDYCDKQVDTRLFLLFLEVILPTFAMTVFGAYCSLLTYRKRLLVDSIDETFNKGSLKIIKRAETFMIFKAIWLMIGFTIWSLRNIITIFELVENDCIKDRTLKDRFWLLNFYIFTFFGVFVSVFTVIVIPGAILFQCYRITERTNETNMYDGARRVTQLGRSQIEGRGTAAMFDMHILANKKKIQRRSEYQTSIEDIRLKMVDIFVRFRYPRQHINANF